MKRIILITLTCLVTITATASRHNEQDPIRYSQHLMREANKLWNNHQYLHAMDSATLALFNNPQMQKAADFIYKHWDQTMRYASNRIEHNDKLHNINHVQIRLETYKLLVEIYDNIKYCHLPLHGVNDSWIWQPEIQYWDGHYQEEEARYHKMLHAKDAKTDD